VYIAGLDVVRTKHKHALLEIPKVKGRGAMSLDFATLDALRIHHPAWRLLRSDHAPLVAGFLHRVFVVPNLRIMAQ
jgi:hypothetical protein